ncbi:eukaryotic translation initiation factor 4 gamma 1-like [Tropilaelaps mercedesae]|uniref:Eukaryotic translation initiation factor 4 gamma 1-like n=1 Tax=Tropilaelaps mercedesae TaxID=418985 RepID=A0A1V9XY14_9ACAR|nr:eukaryotic translation initiation factor 4 gamma 1-like [Tropilaelaps mercedesae]
MSHIRSTTEKWQSRPEEVYNSQKAKKGLHVARSPWLPTRKRAQAGYHEGLRKKILGILNKVTPQRCEQLLDRMRKLRIESQAQLRVVADLLVEKAYNDMRYGSTYAWLCYMLQDAFSVPIIQQASGQSTAEPQQNLLSMLQEKVEIEFWLIADDPAAKQREERGSVLRVARENLEHQKLHNQFEDTTALARQRAVEFLRFIGCLFKLSLVKFSMMDRVFEHLLKHPTDEDFMLCAGELLQTVGEKLAKGRSLDDSANGNPAIWDSRIKFSTYTRNLNELIVRNRQALIAGQKSLSLFAILKLENMLDYNMRGWITYKSEGDFGIEKAIASIPERAYSAKGFCSCCNNNN